MSAVRASRPAALPDLPRIGARVALGEIVGTIESFHGSGDRWSVTIRCDDQRRRVAILTRDDGGDWGCDDPPAPLPRTDIPAAVALAGHVVAGATLHGSINTIINTLAAAVLALAATTVREQ